MAKRALITGVTGQDGALLAEYLLGLGYEVHGIKRRSSLFNTGRIDHIYQDPHVSNQRFFLHYGDLSDSLNLVRIMDEVRPDEVYNLGAMSHVKVSFESPEYTADVDGIGTLRLLEAIRILHLEGQTRFYQASTSELYGLVQECPQTERTPFYPRSPYACAKLYAYWITVNYREAYGMHASNGILFNHESPLRGETFVTRKITRTVARIALGLSHHLYLGNLNAQRDWGHARDYVRSMHLILQQPEPSDYVVATGETTSVREFAKRSFAHIGLQLSFRGEGLQEQGFLVAVDEPLFSQKVGEECLPHVRKLLGEALVSIDPRYYRPSEVDLLLGNASKAQQQLGWQPQLGLADIVSDMVESDLRLMRQDELLRASGFDTPNYHE